MDSDRLRTRQCRDRTPEFATIHPQTRGLAPTPRRELADHSQSGIPTGTKSPATTADGARRHRWCGATDSKFAGGVAIRLRTSGLCRHGKGVGAGHSRLVPRAPPFTIDDVHRGLSRKPTNDPTRAHIDLTIDEV